METKLNEPKTLTFNLVDILDAQRIILGYHSHAYIQAVHIEEKAFQEDCKGYKMEMTFIER